MNLVLCQSRHGHEMIQNRPQVRFDQFKLLYCVIGILLRYYSNTIAVSKSNPNPVALFLPAPTGKCQLNAKYFKSG